MFKSSCATALYVAFDVGKPAAIDADVAGLFDVLGCVGVAFGVCGSVDLDGRDGFHFSAIT